VGGYLFILPSFLGFPCLYRPGGDHVAGHQLSEWGLTGFKGFAGLRNYQQLLRDPVFWQTFWNTAFYIVTIVPLQLALGLDHGVGLNQAIRGVTALPADLLHAGGDDDRGGRYRLSAAAGDQWAGQQPAGVDLRRAWHPLQRAELAGQQRLFQVVGRDPDAVEEHRLHDGRLSGRAARRAARNSTTPRTPTAPTRGSASATSRCR
jgi:hypothetical protein